MKIIVIIIPTSLVTSSLSSLFCPFIETKNKNQLWINWINCEFWSYKEDKAVKCDICNTAERISDIRKYLILVYTFAECNKTPRACEQGKLLVLKLLEKFKAAKEEAHVSCGKTEQQRQFVKPG